MATIAFPARKSVRHEVDCRVCRSASCSTYLEGRGYRLVRCRDCGLRYLSPQPTDQELRDFYEAFDRETTWRGDGEQRFDRAICNRIQRYQKSGSVLDIGSSRGNFLLAMRDAGFSVHGVEPSSKNSGFARSVNDIETHTGTVEEFLVTAQPRRHFDVITMLNVLEHVKDPKDILQRLAPMLAEGGVLALVVPDARLHGLVGRTRKLFGVSDPFLLARDDRPLVGFDPPAHLCSFAPRQITRLIRDCGFAVLEVRNAPIVVTGETWKNRTKPFFYAASQAFYHASFHHLVIGYSTLLLARKLP